jgi:putative ABC transport system permease protein
MTPNIFRILLSSIKFYRKPVLYQVLIIALLSAVITGSLLTGRSVKASLKKSASERLGNTGIMISTGLRYFDEDLAGGMKETLGSNTAGLLEINGFSQSLKSQKVALNTHIYGINNHFFVFHGAESVSVRPGEVAINRRLADRLEINPGDEIIIKFKTISDIPADAPFAPAAGEGESKVMKVGSVLEPWQTGDFSLQISQITPFNIFINLVDLKTESDNSVKINRLLIDKQADISSTEAFDKLKRILRASDAGLRVRTAKKMGEPELVSDRIFIDNTIVREIEKLIPSSSPVLTYMANRIKSLSGSVPYSFVSALPVSVYPEIVSGNEIIINKWLADDISASLGDTLEMYWYSPDSLNKLIENSDRFIVKRIVKIDGIWADSLLMPDFPGIAGSASCSEWDAGVPIKMNEIRNKDEDYWNRYKGTPKAFINYTEGLKIWGSNYGPATAIRFNQGLTGTEIEEKLNGFLDPGIIGFTVTDIATESVNAAEKSVDFGTLFLSLGFFLILASIVLLSFAVSYYFDSKRGIINTFHALGFKNKWIARLFFLESSLIGSIGCLIGAFAGCLVNIIITGALNSVWRGAVQTNTLSASFEIVPILTGFVVTIVIMMVFMLIKIKRHLKSLNRKERGFHRFASPQLNLLFLTISTLLTIILSVISILYKDNNTTFSFGAGTLLLIALIFFWRQIYIGRLFVGQSNKKLRKSLSRLYYAFYPSNAVTPILFIAAGIFAVFITGVNRMNFDEKLLKRSSGTGGYLLWLESNIPVTEDLSTLRGKIALGMDDDSLSAISFTTLKRSAGNDASCLNLNYITTPPLLGVDAADFISRNSFSFAKVLNEKNVNNTWQFLNQNAKPNTIYGIADQTILEWGLKISVGDTLIMRAENGQRLNIIIAGGLKSSIFQGYVLIGKENFNKYFPSVSGSSIVLVDGEHDMTGLYKRTLDDRLANYGVNIEPTTERLKSFYQVTNTYLSVFGVFGALGMITGVAGLGFVLLRNYNQRKREFALMVATGFTIRKIKYIILSEQILILFAGVVSGVISATLATMPSLLGGQDVPWIYLGMMVLIILLTGTIAIYLSVRSISGKALIASLKRE